jgi:DNA replication ATP-dependent helicase Dna2
MSTPRPAQNLFIVNPDTLVSGTRVAESFGCIRRAVLSERIKGVEINREMLVGTLLHELWDKAATKVG